MRGARSVWLWLLLAAVVAVAAAAQEEVDEFEDVDSLQQDASSQQQVPFPTSEAELKTLRRRAPLEFGPLEYAGLATLVLYVLNYLMGRSTNNGLAKRCSDAFRELLTQQFSHVGPAQPAEELDASKASASIFFSDAIHKHTAFCTGRRHCEGMIIDLELQKRQDLVSLLIGMFYPEKDLLVMQAVMEDSMEPIVMAIAPSKHCRDIRNEQPDLKDFTGAVTLPGLEEPLAALGEDAAVVAKLVPADMIKLLNDNAKMIELIHVTDQNAHPVPGWKEAPKKVITFKFRLQSTSNRAVEELRPLVEMALRFIDAVGSTQLSAFSKNKAMERRKKVEDLKFKQTHQQRQELQQQKKLERLQREREMYEHMSEEAKAKYDAKVEKRKQKEERKKQMRVKMIKA